MFIIYFDECLYIVLFGDRATLLFL